MDRQLLLTFFFTLALGTAVGQEFDLRLVRTFTGSAHGLRKAVFSPDGQSFATAGIRGEVAVWDVASGRQTAKMEGHYSSVNDLRYSKDGGLLVTAASDGHVKVWNARNGELVSRVLTSESVSDRVNVLFALLSDDGQLVYFGGDDRRLNMALVGSDEPMRTIYTDRKDPISCATLSPDGREIVFAAGQYLIVLDLATNRVVREYNTGTCQIRSVEFSADGTLLLSWCANSRVDMRDADNFLLKTSFRSGTGGRKFSNMAFSSDQRYVITGDHASRFHMWDLQDRKLVMDAGADQGTIPHFDVNSSSTHLLSASLDRTVKLWEIGEKTEEEKPQKISKQVEDPVIGDQVLILTDDAVDDMVQVETRSEQAQAVVASTMDTLRTESVSAQPLPTSQPVSVVMAVKGDSVSVLPERLKGRRIKPIRSEHRLDLLGRLLTIEVWDAQVIDGDIISIFINDDCIIDEYSIVAERKRVTFDASSYRRVYLYLHAHNVGSIPPNTATMMISDGKQDIQVELRSDLTGSSAMELNFVD